jgi:hypothetical protein
MTQSSISTKLTELFELHKSGALTKEEYDLLKSQVINSGKDQETRGVEKVIPPLTENESVIESSHEVESKPEPLPNSVNETDTQTSKSNPDKNDLGKNSRRKRYSTVIIASISLIVIAAIFFATKKNSSQNTKQVSQLNRSEANTSVNTTPIAKNNTSAWDEAKATKIIMDKLKKHPWDKVNYIDTSKLVHNIMKFTKLSLKDKDVIVALTVSKNGSSERSGVPSLFEFNNQNGWILVKYQVGIGEFMENVNLYKIASDDYCLLTSRNEAGMGQSWEHRVLYAFIKGEFKQIFDTVQDIKFITKNNGYYDIEVTPSGGQPEIYKFNGSEYTVL